MTDVTDVPMTVVGAARSGRAVARLLAEAGARVFLTEQGAPAAGVREALGAAGIAYEFGGHTEAALDGAEVLVVSPGVPSQSALVQRAMRGGRPVLSEIEVAAWFCRAPLVAITGTNGKTTTTEWTGHVLRHAFAGTARRVFVAGNVGTPFASVAREATPDDVVVLEVSSFQLDHVATFRPRVGILLNITPDHLDRYGGDFTAYARSKCRLFAHQGAGDTLVYNHDDALVRRHVRLSAARLPMRTLGFSVETPLAAGAYADGARLVLRGVDAAASTPDDDPDNDDPDNDEPADLMPLDELSLRGQHNRANALAAALAARVLAVPPPVVRAGLARFAGVPHRLEPVAEHAGVRYVNDSKATNVEAVRYALAAFDAPLVLIAGGRDKGNDYAPLKPLVRAHVRAVVAMGESADTVLRELGAEAPAAVRAATMDAAVAEAARLARPGDVVLLSPACSSFDLFAHYEARGDAFRDAVQRL